MSLMDLLLGGPSMADQVLNVVSMANSPSFRSHSPQNVDIPSGTYSQDPWGVDSDGVDLVHRGDMTFDQEAMQSLRGAAQAGLHPWRYIGGTYRSPQASAALHDARYDAQGNLIPGNLPAADAGQSMHNYGLAFDQSQALPPALRNYLLNNGWYNGASFGDPPHWSYGRQG
jgi:hypothetical protein